MYGMIFIINIFRMFINPLEKAVPKRGRFYAGKRFSGPGNQQDSPGKDFQQSRGTDRGLSIRIFIVHLQRDSNLSLH